MKGQNYQGEEIDITDIEDSDEFNLFMLHRELTIIGNLLGLNGKFRLAFGTNQIKERIKELIK